MHYNFFDISAKILITFVFFQTFFLVVVLFPYKSVLVLDINISIIEVIFICMSIQLVLMIWFSIEVILFLLILDHLFLYMKIAIFGIILLKLVFIILLLISQVLFSSLTICSIVVPIVDTVAVILLIVLTVNSFLGIILMLCKLVKKNSYLLVFGRPLLVEVENDLSIVTILRSGLASIPFHLFHLSNSIINYISKLINQITLAYSLPSY